MKMKRIGFGLLLASAVSFATPQLAFIYNPTKTITDQGITLKSWGSGTITQTDDAAYEGSNSIRISTRNFFMGGKINFASPIDLSKQYDNPSELLSVSFLVPEGAAANTGGIGNKGGGKGGPGVGGGGGLSGGEGGLGGGAGGLGGGQKGGGAGQGGATQQIAYLTTLDMIRMVVTTSDDKMSEVFIPCNKGGVSLKNWRTVSVPLQAINGFDRTDKKIKALAFAGNATTTFYVGEVKMINDQTPIYGQPTRREYNLSLGQEIDLGATGSGGTSILKYTWDFDDKDGVQIEADGQYIRRKFRVPGEYTITLTISDFYNLKKPYSTTLKVKVNP